MSKDLSIVIIIALVVSGGLLSCGTDTETNQVTEVQTTVKSTETSTELVNETTQPVSGVHLAAIDRETRSQDDFYQFANGGWLDNTEIPEIYSGYTVYHQVNEVTEEALKKIIESAGESPGEAGSEAQKIGDFYASWMDEEAINKLGVSPIQTDIETIAAISDIPSLVESMVTMYRGSVSMPFGFYIYTDLKDSENYAAYFGQSGLTMPNRDYYLKTDNENFAKAREGLPAYIHDMLMVAGYDDAGAEKGAVAVYSIEEQIAEAQKYWLSSTTSFHLSRA